MRTAILLLCACFATAASAAPLSGWAVISPDGEIVRSSHAVGASNNGSGIYIIEFARAVQHCAFTAALGDEAGQTPAGYVTVAAAFQDPTGVYVTTFDAGGAMVNRGFHLNVRC